MGLCKDITFFERCGDKMYKGQIYNDRCYGDSLGYLIDFHTEILKDINIPADKCKVLTFGGRFKAKMKCLRFSLTEEQYNMLKEKGWMEVNSNFFFDEILC